MATRLSARAAQLLEQRRASRSLYGNTGAIKLLSPANNSVSTIAKQTASAELSAMVSKYNDGLVGNDEMQAFLVKMQGNPSLSNSDKLDIDEQIRNFDSKIQADRLISAYKAAPANSLAQQQAAQALSAFYTQKASTLQPGTPAYVTAADNASQYSKAVQTIGDNIQSTARQNQRYMAEAKINQLYGNTSEKASQKAQMWADLYSQAVEDGDATAANQYYANYQKEVTNAQGLGEKESVEGEKADVRNILNSYVDAYHDGRINESQYLQLLAEIAPRVDATGDYGLINTLNRTTDTIQKNLDKGGVNRGTTASGLPVVLKGYKGSGTGGVMTDWDQKDFNYADNMRLFKKNLDDGTLTPQEYRDAVGMAVVKRATDLEEQIANIESVTASNPNTKVVFNGRKTRAEDVLESLYEEYEDIKGQAQAVEKGTFALVEVPPAEFSSSGKPTKTGKSFATLKPIDTNNMPKNQYVADNEGIYHSIMKNQVFLTPGQMGTVVNNVFYDQSGKSYFVKTDSSGNPFIESGQKSRVYKTGTSESREVTPDDKGVVPGWADTELMTKQDQELSKYAGITIKDEASRRKAYQIAKKKFEEGLRKPASGIVSAEGKSIPVPSLAPQKPVDIKAAVQSGGLTQPVQAPEPKVVAPIVPTRPEAGFGVPQINMPENLGGVSQPQVKQPELKIVGNVQPTPLQKLGSTMGQIKIPSPTAPLGKVSAKPYSELGLPTNIKLNPNKPITTKKDPSLLDKLKGIFKF